MNCESAQHQFAESLLENVQSIELQTHLRDCAACRTELASLRQTWESLGVLPGADPGPTSRARFYQMLEAYQEGAAKAPVKSRADGWFSWLTVRPLWQLAGALALLAMGVGIGNYSAARNQDQQQIATLQHEVSNMRQLVALSLLQQQSANDRLKGVSWTYRIERSDTEVLAALLDTVNHDPNVNVRLAAVDALRNFGDSPVARKGIALSLNKQSDALVQAAVLEVIGDLGVKQAAPEVRSLLEKKDIEDTVRRRAQAVASRIQ